MIDKIVSLIKTGKIKSVVQFGAGTIPTVPYVVVKGESAEGGRGIRVIPHFKKDQQIELEDYMRWLIGKLSEATFTSRNGNFNQLSRLRGYTDVVVVSDDSTISMEALFLMPTMSF